MTWHLQDRSFTFILKTPPASILLKKAANIQKGSGTPQGPAVGSVTADQIRVSCLAEGTVLALKWAWMPSHTSMGTEVV